VKFESQKSVLLEALQIAQNAVPNKTTLQVLNNFLLKLTGNQLEITATDLDLTIIHSVEVQGSQDGSVVVNAKKFVEVVRELADLPVFFSVEDYVVHLRSETGFHCNLVGFDASEYPSMPEETEKHHFSMSVQDLKFLYEKSSFAVSTDVTTRISLTGVYWECRNGQLLMVGTDGHRLGKAQTNVEAPEMSPGVLLPPRALAQVMKFSDNVEAGFQVSISDANVRFQSENVTIYSKQIEGPYPDYEKVIPQDLSRTVQVPKEELISVLRRVSTMAHSKTRQVKFTFHKDSLVLSAKNQDLGGDSEESLLISYNDEETHVGFNAGYVLEVLKLIDTEMVQIKLNSNLGATVFEPVGSDSSYFFIVMPLRLLDEE
jgi:DNA polymerase-3 subunit beta